MPSSAPNVRGTARRLRDVRLRGGAAFDRVFRNGERRAGPCIQVIATPASGRHGRIGYIIARAHLARAVDRNRLRRLMREAARQRRPALDAFDLVLRLRIRCGPNSLVEAGREAATLLDSLLERA